MLTRFFLFTTPVTFFHVIARRNDEAIANYVSHPVKFAIATLRSQ